MHTCRHTYKQTDRQAYSKRNNGSNKTYNINKQ